jgi:hypothetical protein
MRIACQQCQTLTFCANFSWILHRILIYLTDLKFSMVSQRLLKFLVKFLSKESADFELYFKKHSSLSNNVVFKWDTVRTIFKS